MKSAFICPLYDMKNHFQLAYNLYKSKYELGISEKIFYVFSNVEQKDKFSRIIYDSFGEKLDFIVIPEEFNFYKSKVVVKKFYALRELMYKYDFLSLIDSESLFIKKVDYTKLFTEIWENDTCLNGNVSPDGFNIMRTCFRTLSKEIYNDKTIRKEFGNFKYNIWFNEIPVYNCKTLPGFFNWLDSFDKNGWMNEWCCFEYYIYAAYLILYCNKHISKFEIISNGGVMEYLFERPKDEQLSIIEQLGTHWSSSKDAINSNTCMLFHLDRIKGEGNYSFGLTKKQILRFYILSKIVLIKESIYDMIPLLFKVDSLFKRKLT